MEAAVAAPAVAAVGVSKGFPGVRALQDVSFEVARGEIHSLVGENGAGKSTLVKLLAGLLRPDAGAVLVGGVELAAASPRRARRLGVSVIPQDVLAVPDLSVGRNVLLGVEGAWARKDRLAAGERDRVRAALERAGALVDEGRRAGDLSVSELRLCQIANTLVAPGEVIVVDEPTAVLSEADAGALLERLERLRDEGKAIVYVSHRLGEVLRISDRVTVLRDGRVVGGFRRGEVTRDKLIALMAKPDAGVARRRGAEGRRGGRGAGPAPAPQVRLERLSGQGFRDVTLELRGGQVTGIAGVQGAGHGELLRTLAGALPFTGGSVRAGGRELRAGSVADAHRAGIALLPADRRRAAIVAPRSIRDNVALPPGTGLDRHGLRRRGAERAVAARYLARLGIRAPGVDVPTGGLSGGNQQKVALARAIESGARVLLLEEPSQGIDVGAKVEVRELLLELAGEGRALLVAGSEFEELLEVADVIHVMRLGELVASLPAAEASYREILHHALP